jgi:hypothetical protein
MGLTQTHLLFSVFIVIAAIDHYSHDTYMTPRCLTYNAWRSILCV